MVGEAIGREHRREHQAHLAASTHFAATRREATRLSSAGRERVHSQIAVEIWRLGNFCLRGELHFSSLKRLWTRSVHTRALCTYKTGFRKIDSRFYFPSSSARALLSPRIPSVIEGFAGPWNLSRSLDSRIPLWRDAFDLVSLPRREILRVILPFVSFFRRIVSEICFSIFAFLLFLVW